MPNIAKQNARMLSENMRREVIAECKKRMKPTGRSIFVFIITSALFVGGAITILVSGGKVSAIVLTAFFVVVSLLIAYLSFVRPGKLMKMVKEDSYEYYIGKLSKKTALPGEEITYYQLTIGDAVQCGCTEEQYKQAQLGEEYMAIYFGKDSPEFCFKIMEKDTV